MVWALRNLGGVKCKPFVNYSNYWKLAQKMIFKGYGCFYPGAVVTSTAKESLHSTERASLQVLDDI